MEREKLDIHKIMAMLAQPKEKPEPLKEVEIRRVEIPYITQEGKVEKRPIKIVFPHSAPNPIPMIFVAHYEMTEDALELRAYLANGWAVASPTETGNFHNARLTDDDLVFNNAALYALRNMPEIDPDRIAVVGGSAGGYMSLMLNALQLGICCSVANSAISNVYFNFYRYISEAGKYNAEAFLKMTPEERKDIVTNIAKLPIPFLGAVSGLFTPIRNNFPNPEDTARWEAFSPVALSETFCNPLLMTHITSDILVPIDQLSRRFTYEKPGDSLPADYFHRLPSTLGGKLKYSLEERLPKAATAVRLLPMPEEGTKGFLPFDEEKRFNIDIFDEGPIESYGSHRTRPGSGSLSDTAFLEKMFSKTARNTNILSVEKLQLFLDRYEGKSVQLPPHIEIDDTAYGSLTVYRKEIVEELSKWEQDNGEENLDRIFKALIEKEKNIVVRLERQLTMEIIKASMLH